MQAKLKDHLSFLTGIESYRNYWNFEGLKNVVDYLKNELNLYGLNVVIQDWEARGNSYENIIGQYRPDLPTKLIIGAHYDVFSNQPGADDNASGVAGLLVLAEHIANCKPNLPYGIDFVAYCLEEPPFFGTQNMGSYQHALRLQQNSTPLIGMISLDMIGYFSNEEHSQKYPTKELAETYPNVGNFITVIGLNKYKGFNTILKQQLTGTAELPIYHFSFSSNKGLAGLSDHRNYWHFGYPAVMINDTASYRNPHYHKKTDTLETLDLDKMKWVIEAVQTLLTIPLDLKPVIAETTPKTVKTKSSFIERFKRWLRSLNS